METCIVTKEPLWVPAHSALNNDTKVPVRGLVVVHKEASGVVQEPP